MPPTDIVDRLNHLEEQVKLLFSAIEGTPSPRKNWRRTLGIFEQDQLMKEIDLEGQRIRELDREQAKHDHS